MYYIEADCYEAAYLMAKQLSKDINRVVYDPDVYEVRSPKIDAVTIIDRLKEMYGTIAVDNAIRACQYSDKSAIRYLE